MRDVTGWGPGEYWFPDIRTFAWCDLCVGFGVVSLRVFIVPGCVYGAKCLFIAKRAFAQVLSMGKLLAHLDAVSKTLYRSRFIIGRNGDHR